MTIDGKQSMSQANNYSCLHLLAFCVLKWVIRIQMFSYFFQTLAEHLTDKELEEGRLYPPLSNIREVSVQMAVKVSP